MRLLSPHAHTRDANAITHRLTNTRVHDYITSSIPYMELFQLRIEPGSGRAFTPSRGSMVVLTHVALCTSSDDPAVDPNDRITVTVSSNNSASPIALGSVRASGGN